MQREELNGRSQRGKRRRPRGRWIMHRLITLSFSHYNEKARWSLDRFAVPYTGRAIPTLFLLDGRRRRYPRTWRRRRSYVFAVLDSGSHHAERPRAYRFHRDRKICRPWRCFVFSERRSRFARRPLRRPLGSLHTPARVLACPAASRNERTACRGQREPWTGADLSVARVPGEANPKALFEL